MWKRVHNHSHHHFGNTINDPDRFYTQAELEGKGSKLRNTYVALFFPHKNASPLNPLVWFHFITYVIRHLVAAFYSEGKKPSVVTFKPSYSKKHIVSILTELLCIVCIQLVIYLMVGQNFMDYLWASPVAILFTSTIVMMYVWTNHYLFALDSEHDPVKSSATVEVPQIFNILHSNFSYHTEHHIFPSMNSDYAPLLSQFLKEKYPEKYNIMPITEAWDRLFKIEKYTDTNS